MSHSLRKNKICLILPVTLLLSVFGFDHFMSSFPKVNVQDLTVSTAFIILGLKIARGICGFSRIALSGLIYIFSMAEGLCYSTIR